MAKKGKVRGKPYREKAKAGGHMPESHAHMTPAEHKKAMAKMGKKKK